MLPWHMNVPTTCADSGKCVRTRAITPAKYVASAPKPHVPNRNTSLPPSEANSSAASSVPVAAVRPEAHVHAVNSRKRRAVHLAHVPPNASRPSAGSVSATACASLFVFPVLLSYTMA